MDELLRIIYRRRDDGEQLDESQAEEPEDVPDADERGAVVLRE